ncbi:MAG TPA: MFS transporter [Solirubrobacterales bacterium]|nr:MFS transporter [Solirubrobacterales bacterium]
MTPEKRRLAPLSLPGFGRLAAAYMTNELGNWLGEIALAIVVFEVTGSPLAVAALFVAMQFVPALTTPLLVARIDAMSSRRALPLLYLGEAAAFCALAVLATDSTFVLAAVFVIAAVDGTLATAARARTRAAAGAILDPAGLLREGNGILNFGFTAGAAAGPALAGLLVATAGAQVALLADAVSFVAVAILLATSHALGPTEAKSPEEGRWTDRLRLGFKYVKERPVLRRLIGAEAVAFVFFALVLPIEVAFAKETLDAGDFGYGLLLASWGAGMVVGSLIFSGLRNTSLVILLVVGTVAIGVGYLGMAISPGLAIACVASGVGGAGNGVQWVAIITAIQELTAEAYQARVLGLLESLASGLSGVGFLLGGAIAAVVSPRASFAVAGAGVLLVLVSAVLILRGVRWERLEASPARPVPTA